ncbi:uncharacterized protein EAF01_008535 [Botrytis porri]|uniref:uncharacterized protein n=1 Tax=Botrytis porri TaxID=87229 RepID=UPI00190178C7|nr:uncharacterized protein EAF01_008535 [Botrytis porri]KAF7899322.1 hypothetical protein EAF01_008535 [Botrytis porri]
MSALYSPEATHYESLEDQRLHESGKENHDDFSKSDEEELFLERHDSPSHQKQHSHKRKIYIVAAVAIIIALVSITFGAYSTLRFQALKHTYNSASTQQPSQPESHSHESHEHKHEHLPISPTQSSHPTHPDLDCGNSEATAKAAGCTFNIMAFSYVPAACNGSEIMSSFVDKHANLPLDGAGIFPWYRWSNRTEPVPQDANELSKYPFIWTTHEWHIAHCLYNWALTTNAISRVLNEEKNVWILQDAVQGGHIAHCNGLVSDRVTSGLTPLRAFRAIGRCVKLDTDGVATLSKDPYGSHVD